MRQYKWILPHPDCMVDNHIAVGMHRPHTMEPSSSPAAARAYQHAGTNRRGTACHFHAIEQAIKPAKVPCKGPAVVNGEGHNSRCDQLDGRPAKYLVHVLLLLTEQCQKQARI